MEGWVENGCRVSRGMDGRYGWMTEEGVQQRKAWEDLWMVGWSEGWRDRWQYRLTFGWMGGLRDGWMERQLDNWMDGGMDRGDRDVWTVG